MCDARHPFPKPHRRPGFSLPELLIVIAVLTILLALLFPVLRKARRAAAALAAPVAYLGTDSQVHLTDARGGLDLQFEVVANRAPQCPVCHSPPVWSPSGQTLTFSLMAQGQRLTAFVEPASGKVRTVREDRYFLGWMDSEHYVESQSRSALYVRREGGPPSYEPLVNESRLAFLAPAPANAPGAFIASVQGDEYGMIAFLRKDLSLGRAVWREPAAGILANEQPRVDPFGEYVAWSKRRDPAKSLDSTVPRFIALKHISEPASRPPSILGAEYLSAYFCDWTEDGRLLANVSDDNRTWRLVVLDRDGSLCWTLNTTVPPAAGVIASWRKYGHR
jgi:prepilin-type N-terminal cleavage/methylation domain-containing protein